MLIESKDKHGNVTLKVEVNKIDDTKKSIYIASKYDVLKEAKEFALNHKSRLTDINLLYGLGLGYHVKELLKFLKVNQKLIVFDLRIDIFKFAQSRNLYKDFEKNPNVIIIVNDNEKILADNIEPFLTEDAYFITHTPSIKSISDNNSNFRFILERIEMTRIYKHNIFLQELLYDNLSKNSLLNDYGVEKFFNKFIVVPGIIVSAGSSLEFSIEQISKIEDKAFIFAVGRSLTSLLKIGVKPHMFCIIDAEELTYEQIKGYENENIPLMYLNTASYLTVSSYKGPRFVFYNSNHKIDHIDTGGSVATAVFSLLIRFGCNPIIFVGQDLAYTNNQTHYKDAKYSDSSIEIKELKNMRKVKSVNGEYLNTDLGLISFKKWFEKKIRQSDRIFINSSFGADIEGTLHMPLEEAEKNYMKTDLDIRNRINGIINSLRNKGD